MEKINKHNYEAYFLDYLEGNLSAEEKADLFAFLEENPALKNELDIDLNDVTLNPKSEVYSAKENLKVEDDSILTLASAEFWMIESIEKNLSASKQKELEDFIQKHKLEKTYSTYQATLLKPDLNLIYADKQKLKVATGIIIPLYARVASIAAVGIILIGVAISQFRSNENTVANDSSGYFAKTSFGINHLQIDFNENDTNAFDKQQTINSNLANYNLNYNQKNENKIEKPNVNFDENLVEQKDSVSADDNKLPDDEKIADVPLNNDPDSPMPDNKDDVAIITPFNSENRPTIVTEEPYKIVTDAASNFTNRDVHFTREKNTTTNEYVAYGFKIGNFEFERKKSE